MAASFHTALQLLPLWLKLCSLPLQVSVVTRLMRPSAFISHKSSVDSSYCSWWAPNRLTGFQPNSPGRLDFKAPADCGAVRLTGIGVFSRMVWSIPLGGFLQECQRATWQELPCHAAFLQPNSAPALQA